MRSNPIQKPWILSEHCLCRLKWNLLRLSAINSFNLAHSQSYSFSLSNLVSEIISHIFVFISSSYVNSNLTSAATLSWLHPLPHVTFNFVRCLSVFRSLLTSRDLFERVTSIHPKLRASECFPLLLMMCLMTVMMSYKCRTERPETRAFEGAPHITFFSLCASRISPEKAPHVGRIESDVFIPLVFVVSLLTAKFFIQHFFFLCSVGDLLTLYAIKSMSVGAVWLFLSFAISLDLDALWTVEVSGWQLEWFAVLQSAFSLMSKAFVSPAFSGHFARQIAVKIPQKKGKTHKKQFSLRFVNL